MFIQTGMFIQTIQMEIYMREWQLQDAKSRLSEPLRRAREEGPQTATVHAGPPCLPDGWTGCVLTMLTAPYQLTTAGRSPAAA
jgi:hypothetical protein